MKKAAPEDVQLVGAEVAVRWTGGREDYFPMEYLRANSPSAENVGETDILGQRHGGGGPRAFPGVTVTGFDFVGNYAIRFVFSDGHATGLYSYSLLQALGDDLRRAPSGGG